MEPRLRKINSKSGNDIPSPLLLRRRLSAPETVMRKYKLARARSQENDSSNASDSKFCDLSYESNSSSDLNLQKKKDSAVLMRKSTLLRRLMHNPKTFGSSSFQEWQHYCGKLSTPSLNSLQGSPEHLSKSYSRRSLVGYEFKTSPKHTYGSRKASPVRQSYDHHKGSLTQINSTSPKRRIEINNDSHAAHGYYSHSQKATSTVSSQRPRVARDLQATPKPIYGDHSDSAYSNDKSNFSPASISSCSTNVTTQESLRFRKDTKEKLSKNIDQRIMDENRNFPVNTSFNYVTQESSTQTSSTTNLNVISNVQLSQTTLDMIVNEVMKDVQKTYNNGNAVQEKTCDTVHVPKISGARAVTNSQYDEELTPRNDAVERLRDSSSKFSVTSSRTSIGLKSGNFTDDNSDIISLADSLDDTTSSRMSLKNHDNKPVRGDLPPLKKQQNNIKHLKSSDSFFVPMKKNEQKDVKSMSDYLPKKLKEKISQRQQDLQDKLNQSKSSFASNLTRLGFKESNDDIFSKTENSVYSKLKSKSYYKKPVLPSIETTKKLKKDQEAGKSKSKQKNRKKFKENMQHSKENQTSDPNSSKKHFHLYRTENEYLYNDGPKRIYHKAEFRNSSRRIEILEIMECVDFSQKTNQSPTKVKSKIPVLVNQRSPKISDTASKVPTYLDFDKVVITDPKLDQLIANILIQTLSQKEQSENKENAVKDASCSADFKQNNPPIPEKSVCVSNDNNGNFMNNENKTEFWSEKNKARLESPKTNSNEPTAPELLSGDNLYAFYMQQKKEESNDTSEGRGPDRENIVKEETSHVTDYRDDISPQKLRKHETLQEVSEEEHGFKKTDVSDRIEYKKFELPPPSVKTYAQSCRRSKYRNIPRESSPGEWSIVLSGKNNAPFTSDLEMKIRFPSSHRAPQIRSGIRDYRDSETFEDRIRFPRIDEKYLSNFHHRDEYHDDYNTGLHNFSKINKRLETDKLKVSDRMSSVKSLEITDMRPRQTKTSLRRYKMTRPKLHPLFESNVYDFDVGRQYPDIMRRFPHLLRVNGNSISPERKLNSSRLNRRDVPKHNCTSHNI